MSRSGSLYTVAAIFLIYLTLRFCWFTVPSVFESLELRAQDNMLHLAYSLGLHKETSPDIVYIDLDDNTLATMVYSANDPKLYATLISILNQAGVSLQLIDILFSNGNFDGADTIVMESVKRAGTVYLPLIMHSLRPDTQPDNALPQEAQWLQAPAGAVFPKGTIERSAGIEVGKSAAGLGHINCWPDYDGVYRRVPLFMNTGSHLVPTLPLRAAADYLQVSPQSIEFTTNSIRLPDAKYPDGRKRNIVIPHGPGGKNRVNFIGPWPRVFAHYSVSTILETGRSPAGIQALRDELEGTLAIISDVTTGGRDYGPIPFSTYSPLSSIHTHFLNSVVTNSFVKEAGAGLSFLLDAAVALLLIITAVRFRGFTLILSGSLVIVVIVASIFGLYAFLHMIFPAVRPVLFFGIGVIAVLLFQFIQVKQEKEIIKIRLSPYFAPSVMNKILDSPDMLSAPSKKHLTILFSDIAGFTSWSADKEADEIHRTLNRYFLEMSDIVFSFEGTIDKFMGDGMLAFFGDPTAHEDHAKRAVMAALAMQERTRALRKEWAASGGMDIRIRIGIHSGEVVVGDMGSSARMEYTIIGSNVNLAQRLESNGAPDKILISGEVLRQLDDTFMTTSNGQIQAKGFNTPVEVFWVDGYRNNPRQNIQKMPTEVLLSPNPQEKP